MASNHTKLLLTDVGRAYFVRRPSRQSFGFRVAASSGPIPKAPGSAGGYLPSLDAEFDARGLSLGRTAAEVTPRCEATKPTAGVRSTAIFVLECRYASECRSLTGSGKI